MSLTWEQVTGTGSGDGSPDYIVSIAQVGTKLFAATRSVLTPSTYIGGMYVSNSGGAWAKINAGLSARIYLCGDFPTCSADPGGTFTLSYLGQTTSSISFGASMATIQSALEGLSTIGSGNVAVTDSWATAPTITFQGARANADPTDITVNTGGLTGTSPGGVIRGPRHCSQLWKTPSGALLATVRNNNSTELFRLASGGTTWVKSTGVPLPAGFLYDYTDDGSGNLIGVNTVSTDNVFKSTDDGVSWSALATISTACTSATGGSDPHPLGIYRASSSIAPNNTLFAVAHHDTPHYSTDGGSTWNCISIQPGGDDLPFAGSSFLRINGGGQPYFGGENGGFFIHTGAWADSTWTYPSSPGSGGYLTGNAETVHDAITLSNGDIIVHGKRIYRSTDSGGTFVLDDSGIPAGDINNYDSGGTFALASHTLAVGSDGKLYLAIVNQTTGWGIYRTTTSVVRGVIVRANYKMTVL